MLEFLIKIFEEGEVAILKNNLATVKYVVENQTNLDNLKNIDINEINDEKYDIKIYEELIIGSKYKFDIVLSSLRRFGFYYTCSDFITSNKKLKKEEFYIYEIKSSNKSNNIFIKNFLDIFSINEFIRKISIESGNEKIIFLENKYLKLLIDYSHEDISKTEKLFEDQFITSFLQEYENLSKEIRIIFKNELLEFLEPINKNERFKYLFKNFKEFNEKCILGYEYYLSNFSYNKLKAELNNAVFDFHKNIRSVINDSQSKLIAIPAAVLLIFTTINTNDIIQNKNFFILLSSLIFTMLMNFFIVNQLTALSIIKANKDIYLELFEKKKDSEKLQKTITDLTSNISKELQRQRVALISINVINWAIPFGLIIYILAYVLYYINEINF
jgi:hypothetical protein